MNAPKPVNNHDRLVEALRPFVDAYNKAADPIGDSDLYGEQPRAVYVTLGDCRKAALILSMLDKGTLCATR